MSSEVNKPTGLGFQGSPWRTCSICLHEEGRHYGKCCFAPDCTCQGLSLRDLSEAEKRIIAEQEQLHKELEYVDEALYGDIKREVKHRG